MYCQLVAVSTNLELIKEFGLEKYNATLNGEYIGKTIFKSFSLGRDNLTHIGYKLYGLHSDRIKYSTKNSLLYKGVMLELKTY